MRLVIVGAGPAAVMLLERLLATHRTDHPGLRLDVRLVDPHEPGGGRIWRLDQSPLLKLNSMLEDVAFFTDASSTIDGPIEPGPSLSEWVRRVRTGELPLPDGVDELLEAEIADIGDRDFPTRRLNNLYLGWAYREVLRRAAPTATVRWHRGTVVAVTPAGDAPRLSTTDSARSAEPARAAVGSADAGPDPEPHTVQLASGERLAADVVVYAIGHNGSLPSDDSVRLGAFADRHGLGYVAPAFTADIDLDWVAAGRDVIVRGMGLAAVDLTVLLAEGRGGTFERGAGGRLVYRPSGREPVLHLGSRRGVPYRSKVTSVTSGAPVQLEYLGDDFRASLASRTEPLDFEADIWPRIGAELVTGYYRELFTAYPERVVGDWPGFVQSLQRVLAEPGGATSPELDALIRTHVPHADDRFDLASFDRPLAFLDEAGPEADTAAEPAAANDVQQRVLRHIARDLRQRTSPQHSATQALFLTALFAYMSVAEIPAERWNAVSRARSLPRRWHSYFSYLASGPPGHRLDELIALAEAGVVRFLGADVRVELDESAGRFVASGAATTADGLARTRVTAETLIDAWLPEAQAGGSDNPLLRQLVGDGVVTELSIADADFAGGTGQVVVEAGGVLPGAPRQFALGPFTSIPGAGAFTRPGINSLPFRLHDRCARVVLAAAAEVAEAAQRPASDSALLAAAPALA